MRKAATWTIALAIVLLGFAQAAQADVEPNNGITQAEGPLVGGVPYTGAIQTDNDVDWYVFYVAPQTQLDLEVTTPSGNGCSTYASLDDTDGNDVTDVYAGSGETEHIRYTTPAAISRFLLRVDGCTGGRYQFKLLPAASIVTGPPVPVPVGTGEPNETFQQAIGPLSGATTYAGAAETENDVDWFYFFTSGAVAFDLAATNVEGCSPYTRLYRDGEDDSLGSLSPDENETAHMTHTAAGSALYRIEVTSCRTGSRYQLRLEPGGAISPALVVPPPVVVPPPAVTPPPPAPAPKRPVASRRCRAAKAGQARWTRSIARTKRQIKRVRTRSARRVLKRQLAAKQRTLRRARDRVTIYCR